MNYSSTDPAGREPDRYDPGAYPVYAGFPERWWGWLIDTVVILTLAFLMTFVIGFILQMLSIVDYSNPDSGNAATTAVFVLLAVYFIYNLTFELTSGRTIGKRATGTKVLSDNGQPLSVTQSLLRNGFRLGGELLLFNIPALIAIWRSKKKQRVGDMVARTVVVKHRG